MPNRRIFITALFVKMALCFQGCTAPQSTASSLVMRARESDSLSPPASSSNLEELESQTALQNNLPQEARNLRLSRLWAQRADELSTIAGPGSLAALLRSAHFAIESLLSEPCANPFNETCRDLHKVYLKSTQRIVREVARNGWEFPELAPSRYRFSNTDAQQLRNLRDWRLSLDSSTATHELDRPGLGLPAVGCREGWSDDAGALAGLSICSPITFIITFERPTSEDRLTAHLSAVNAYEQEVFETRSTAVPVAAATTAALETLLKGADESSMRARLWCLSKPERTTTIALGITSSPTLPSAFSQGFNFVAATPEMQSAFTPCVYNSNSGQPLTNATELLRLLRALVAPKHGAPIEQAPIRIVPFVSGKEAVAMARSMAARIKRQTNRARRAPNQPTTFSLPAIGVNTVNADPATVRDLSRYAGDLHTSFTETSDQSSLLELLPEILHQHRAGVADGQAHTIPTSNDSAPASELSVSPVM